MPRSHWQLSEMGTFPNTEFRNAALSISILAKTTAIVQEPKKEPESELVGIEMIFKRFQMDWIMKQNQCIWEVLDFQTVSNSIPTGIYRLMGYLKPFENRVPPNALVLLHNPLHLKPFENHPNPHQFGFGFLFGPLTVASDMYRDIVSDSGQSASL